MKNTQKFFSKAFKKHSSSVVAFTAMFALALGLSWTVHGTFADKEAAIDNWWPEDGAVVSGVQPFKAKVEGKDVNNYEMYWQVDGDRWNHMPTSYEDYPHKRADVDVSTWGWNDDGPYEITFIATTNWGEVISEKSVDIYTSKQKKSGWNRSPEKRDSQKDKKNKEKQDEESSDSDGEEEQPEPVNGSDNPFAAEQLHVNLNAQAQDYADSVRDSDPYAAELVDKIADQPTAEWFGDWGGNIYEEVRSATDAIVSNGAMPVYVAYNMYQRDCGSYSAGGASSPDEYRQWIRSFTDGIGGNKAVVVLEPDAVAGMDCLSAGDRQVRLDLLRYAVEELNSAGNISVYIDAGNPNWQEPGEMAERLQDAGIGNARGFALNVSNFVSTPHNIEYGEAISSNLGGKNFIVDTSRNGLGSDGEWCNPTGRALGLPPTADTGHDLADAFVWIKVPGESDGECNGGPSAGTFWPEYAIGLAERADW